MGEVSFCNIEYTFISLSDEASENMHKENMENAFNEHMKKWEDSLNYYLKYSEMLID